MPKSAYAMPNPSRPATAHVATDSPERKTTEEKPEVLTPEDTVATAGARMRAHGSEEWPVAEDRKLVGTVKEKDPERGLSAYGHDPKSWQVGQIMSRDIVFCYEDEDCASAEKTMEEHGVLYLPVVDREMRVLGIFSREEVRRGAHNPGGSKPAGRPFTSRAALEQ